MKKKIERIKSSLQYRYPIVEIYSVIRNISLHVKYSFKPNGPLNNQESYIFYLTKGYHIIEKGLSLPNPRAFFGRDKIRKLIYYTIQYVDKYGSDCHVANINSALKNYVDLHAKYTGYESDALIVEISAYLNLGHDTSNKGDGGVELVKRRISSHGFSLDDYRDFTYSRHSVRDFSSKKVSAQNIYEAIRMSVKTPSVCNRQGWGVYAYFERDKIDTLLEYQNGNAGFGNHSQCLLIIVGKSRAFTRFEYNQLYVDAGMFAMSIINALHALELGTCALNLCMPYGREAKLKKVAEISDDERLVMMIAVGHKKDEYLVAKSPRMNVESVLRIN